MPHRRPHLLLIEPDTLVRRTVASVSRTLELAEVSEASTYDNASLLLRTRAFDGLIIALAEDDGGLKLVEHVRGGYAETARDCPVVVMTAQCDAARATTLRAMGVRRVIIKPFKVKTVLDSVAQLVREEAMVDA